MNKVKTSVPFGKNKIDIEIPTKNFFESLEISNTLKLDNLGRSIGGSLSKTINSASLAEIAEGKKDACNIVFDIVLMNIHNKKCFEIKVFI